MAPNRRYAKLLERAENSASYWSAQPVAEFIDSVCRLMERRKIRRKDLADRMGTSKAYVTKLLGGNANLSIATMVKVAMALDGALHTHVADKDATVHWVENYQGERPKLVQLDSGNPIGQSVRTFVQQDDAGETLAQATL